MGIGEAPAQKWEAFDASASSRSICSCPLTLLYHTKGMVASPTRSRTKSMLWGQAERIGKTKPSIQGDLRLYRDISSSPDFGRCSNGLWAMARNVPCHRGSSNVIDSTKGMSSVWLKRSATSDPPRPAPAAGGQRRDIIAPRRPSETPSIDTIVVCRHGSGPRL